MPASPWSDAENDLIVADYFAMLSADLAGSTYNKREHNRALRHRIGRSHGSIEFKHQNISAVLKGLGETWIPGYKPAFHIQASLVDAVERWLATHSEWFERSRIERLPQASAVEPAQLWIGPPPTLSNQPPPHELEQMSRIAARFDAAQRDAANRALGRAGEEFVLQFERAELAAANRPDLAERVRWVSSEDGDGAGFDIASFRKDGRDRLIEVKTTNGWERTPFHISRNELVVSEMQPDNWLLMRLWDFSRRPRAFELRPPLDAHVSLMPTSFQASFNSSEQLTEFGET